MTPQLIVNGLANKPVRASLLEGGGVIEVKAANNEVTLTLPRESPDTIPTVVALEVEGTPGIGE